MAALCPLPDNHFKRNSGDRRVVRGEGAGAAAPPDRLRLSEALADEVLALRPERLRSEEHTSELQSLMRISYAVFYLRKKNKHHCIPITYTTTTQIVIKQ